MSYESKIKGSWDMPEKKKKKKKKKKKDPRVKFH
jgi:hypothetical protein